MKTNTEILKSLVSDHKSNWEEKFEFIRENKAWLDKSARIALKILRHLRENNISQKELAEKVNVSPQFINRIVKGSENLTLQTISNIEQALGISLVDVRDNLQIVDYETSSQKVEKYSNIIKFPSYKQYYNDDCETIGIEKLAGGL
jgi:transcriptional regulator with XRE-family HTH domain